MLFFDLTLLMRFLGRTKRGEAGALEQSSLLLLVLVQMSCAEARSSLRQLFDQSLTGFNLAERPKASHV